MVKHIENVLVNGVFPHNDRVPFAFFEGIEIPFRNVGEYGVAVHTPQLDNAIKICHNYLGDKYIKLLSNKYSLYGQPEIVNGVDAPSTNWHNDLKEGANVAILMYFTSASNPTTGGCLKVRNAETKSLSCMIYPAKADLVILNHNKVWEHKVEEFERTLDEKTGVFSDERIVGCFDFNI